MSGARDDNQDHSALDPHDVTADLPGPRLEAGSEVGHFRIERELGHGGAGIVYLARDTKLGRQVAIKSLPPQLANDVKTRARFQREAKLLASLNHPNVATIHEELEEAEGQTYLVLEYAPGETLGQRITRGPLAPKDALATALEIAEAMVAAHAKGVIHRDLKPENVKITPEGRTKVLDFGIAKMVGGAASAAVTITEPGRIIGTPGYMSPEQARGEPADHRTDIWSFGCILYEMLTGRSAFPGETASEALASVLKTEPDWQLLPSSASCVRRVTETCLRKSPEQRYQSAAELLAGLHKCRESLTPSGRIPLDTQALRALLRKPTVAAGAVLVLLALFAGGGWLIHRGKKIRWAREVAMPAVLDFTREDRYAEAFSMAREAEKYIAGDPMLARLWPEMARQYSVTTDPPGARLAYREYSQVDKEWVELGYSPANFMLPFGTYRWMITKPGFVPREFVRAGYPGGPMSIEIVLHENGAVPQDMVLIEEQNGLVKLDRYWIDKYEVTNEQFRKFVDAGGYEKQIYWKRLLAEMPRDRSWKEAVDSFRDQTNRPGPKTWEGGSFPEGQSKYPVSGVSWYEAAAYAEFAGKSLPTVHHWRVAARTDEALVIVPFSNFGESGPLPVGASQGIGSAGLYDVAGNVREWCHNATDESGSQRYILGGAWGQPSYVFADTITQSPWNRDAINGFRCALYLDNEGSLAEALAPYSPAEDKDFTNATPIPDDELELHIDRLYAYKPANADELNIKVESIDTDSSLHWRKEKITYRAAYDGEHIIAYLFLPKAADPPYQPIIYFPGVGAQWPDSSDVLADFQPLDFIIKGGRAVLYPVYKGTYERRFPKGAPSPVKVPEQYLLWVTQLSKDLRRSVDYLMTRDDLDAETLTYCGLSWGAVISPIMLTVEKRIKFAILIDGGFIWRFPDAADPVNFAPRVKCPVLMVNGRQDSLFPLKTSQEPMFELLGTPDEDKEHAKYPGGHGLFGLFSTAIRDDVLNWMDARLGPVD